MAAAEPLARALRILDGIVDADDTPEVPAGLQPFAPIEAYAGEPSAAAPEKPKSPITFLPIADIVAQRRECEWLPGLYKILERGVLAVEAGRRMTFKSFVGHHWCMTAAANGAGVVILSGEGAGLDRRTDAWMRTYAPTAALTDVHIVAIERPVNLNGGELVAVSDAIAALPWPVDLVMIDTLSKFSAGLDENDNGEVAEFLAALTRHIRDRFECTVLLVAHAGHGEQARPRGASALMANPDAEYIVERPDPLAMTVTVTRERFKDGPALPPLAYEARVVDLDRVDRYGEPVTSLVMVSGDAPRVDPKATGRNQNKALIAFREWLRTHPDAQLITSIEISELFKAHSIGRQRRPEVLNFMVNSRILTAAAGGYSIDRSMA
jgi:hypothetical protein